MCYLKEESSTAEVISAAKSWMKPDGRSQAELARNIGKSNSLVSQFISGKYGHNVTEMRSQLIEFLNREHMRKVKKVEIPHVHTSHAKSVLSVCNLVHESRTIGLIHGPSGYGKSTGLKMYLAQSTAIRIAAYSGITSGAMFMMIFDKLNIKPPKKGSKNSYMGGNQGLMMKTIVDVLRGKDMMIIVDEAHWLRLQQFEQIRYIHDESEIPIIYCGNDEILERMTGRQQYDYDQIYSRVPIVKNLDSKAQRKDVLEILNKADIGVDNQMVDFLYKKANERGHYRKMINILKNALRFSLKEKSNLEMAHLLSAEELVLGKAKLA